MSETQTVFTVMGEWGNSDGPYTRELPSMAAALDAIRTGDLPLCPLAEQMPPLCLSISEHSPLTNTGPGQWSGGHWYPVREYRLVGGVAVEYTGGRGLEATRRMKREQIPAAWVEYQRLWAALPDRPNYADAYRDVLGIA